MHQARVIASYCEDIPNTVFFSEILLPDELDLEAIFFGNPFGIAPQFISKGFGETWIVEDPNLIVAQESRHPL